MALAYGGRAGAQGRVRGGWFYRNQLGFSLNPRGLSNDVRVGYRWRLWGDPRASILRRNTYVAATGGLVVSPAGLRATALVEVQPLQVVTLWAQYDATRYHGNFGYLPSFAYAQTDYSDTAIDRNNDAGRNRPAVEHRFTLGASLQARVGDVIVQADWRGEYLAASLPAGDRVYYDIWNDSLTADGAWTFVGDANVLYALSDVGVYVGAHWTTVVPTYPDDANAPGRGDNPNGPTHRVGPVVAWRIFERSRGWFNAPTITALVNWYVTHRFRTGADVAQEIPYVALAFSFRGDT